MVNRFPRRSGISKPPFLNFWNFFSSMRLMPKLVKLAPVNPAEVGQLAAAIVLAMRCPASTALSHHTRIHLLIGRRSGTPIKVSLFATTLLRFKTILRQSILAIMAILARVDMPQTSSSQLLMSMAFTKPRFVSVHARAFQFSRNSLCERNYSLPQ